MPIRFTCLGCGKRLSAGSHKAGQQAKCPICRQIQLVPDVNAADSERPPPPPPTADVPKISTVNSAGSRPWDTSDEIVYSVPEDRRADRTKEPAGDQTITVGRHIVYLQGVLLSLVALVFFVFGIIVGTHSSNRSNVRGTRRPCTVSGQVTVQDARGHAVPDSGCTACLVPTSAYPETKFAATAFRPGSASLPRDRSAAELVRQLGGDFVRTDSGGRYQLRVPSPGRYYLLVISHHAFRAADESPSPRDLAQMGRYFLPVTDLLDDHKYSWQVLQLRSVTQKNIIF